MVKGKVNSGQAPSVVINMADTPVTVENIKQYFKDSPIPDLDKLIVIDQSGIIIRII